MTAKGINVVLVCREVVLRGEIRDDAPIPRRLSDILNSGIDDVEVYGAEALTANTFVGILSPIMNYAPGSEPVTIVRRSAILVALPVGDSAHRPPGWDTYVEKLPESASIVVGDVIVRGNVWRLTGADLAMTMRAQTGNFLPVTEAEISRAPGSNDPFSAGGVAIVNRAAIRMWSSAPAIPVAPLEHAAPEPVPVRELVGTSVGRRVPVLTH